MKQNVILIGFMGTGKTSIGQLLAKHLGRTFIDIDKKIEDETQLTIPKIFKEFGEEHFRALEKMAVRELSEQRGLVIATGGGTVKDAENIRLLKNSGVIICLTSTPEEIFKRTRRRGERPILDGANTSTKDISEDDNQRLIMIRKLLAERKKFYDCADYQVETTKWSPIQIVDDIYKYLKMLNSL